MDKKKIEEAYSNHLNTACNTCGKLPMLCLCGHSKKIDYTILGSEPFTAGVQWAEEQDKWVRVEDAPLDGTKILGCHIGYYDPKEVSYRTYHPNAQGKKTWRDSAGNKVVITHWQPLPSPPKS